MATRNDITGDTIATKGTSEQYRNNYDAIFGKKKSQTVSQEGNTENDTDRTAKSGSTGSTQSS